jgi:cation transport regulator
MPYNSVADLPKAQTDQYNPHQKEAFLKAFNNAYKEYGDDESRAVAVAHSAAKKLEKSRAQASWNTALTDAPAVARRSTL